LVVPAADITITTFSYLISQHNSGLSYIIPSPCEGRPSSMVWCMSLMWCRWNRPGWFDCFQVAE
jgi:hypothetical protein